MGLNEADTCRVYVTPKLREAGWEKNPRSLTEQYTFTNGRVFVTGNTVRRGERQRADYLLRYTRDFPMAVVEAKPEDDPAGQGMQQAKKYAEILGLKFAYATNGAEIAGSRRLQVQEGQFIVSRIDARNGAFGLIPQELDGAVVSNDFPVFNPIQEKLLPEYLGWLSKTCLSAPCQQLAESGQGSGPDLVITA